MHQLALTELEQPLHLPLLLPTSSIHADHDLLLAAICAPCPHWCILSSRQLLEAQT